MDKVIAKDNMIYDATQVGKGKTCSSKAVIAIVTNGNAQEISKAINKLELHTTSLQSIRDNAHHALNTEADQPIEVMKENLKAILELAEMALHGSMVNIGSGLSVRKDTVQKLRR